MAHTTSVQSWLVQKIMTIALPLLTIQAGSASAQVPINGLTSLDVPSDARSIALGESFTAVPGDPSAPMYNPAGLGSIEGVRAFYAHRASYRDTYAPHAALVSAAVIVPTPIGTLGVLYNRDNYGETPAFPGPQEWHTNMLAVALGRTVADRFSVGAALKGFDEQYSAPGLAYQTWGCFLFDVGLLFTTIAPMNVGGTSGSTSFSAGLSLQNFGTDLQEQVSGKRVTVMVPRYLRVGLSYGLGFPAAEIDALKPFSVLVSAEYRNCLNATDHDYWGFGFESVFYEVLTLRIGGFVDGVGSPYGVRGVPALRYGAGLTVPLVRLGAAVPLVMKFDYALIPLQQVIIPGDNSRQLSVFTAGLSYEAGIF